MSPRPLTPLTRIPNFDPRQVPVVGVDAHLPGVAPQQLTQQALRARFATPPVWAPEVVRDREVIDRPPADAAVLLAVVQRDEPMVLLTQRSSGLPTHSGQIAFPGGKVDAEDEGSMARAALREAHEEIGLDPAKADVIGLLPRYTTVTAFEVTPVVALVQPDVVLRPNPGEVDDVFEVPLAWLMNPRHHRRHAIDFEGQRREWFSMPYDDAGRERFIWGATAAMLRNFYRFLIA